MDPLVVLREAVSKIGDAGDVSAIQAAMLECGLYPYEQWMLNEFPRELYPHCGRGIGLWQYPNQFAPYLASVARRIGRVPSLTYAEVGVAAGGTFMFTCEYLRRFCVEAGGVFRAYAADIARPSGVYSGTLDRFVMQGNGNNVHIKFIEGDCVALVDALETDGVDRMDVLLIDGDHTYEGVTKDYIALKDKARVLVFHDIVNQACPGVCRIWREIKTSGAYQCEEFTDQYPSVAGTYLGIGVCETNV